MERVAVVGAGIMGHGIAQVAAMAGLATTVYDMDGAQLQRAQAGVARSLARLVKAGRCSEAEAAAAQERITFGDDLEAAVQGADVVFEAIPERFTLKQELFRTLDGLCAPAVLLASNTSQFSITALAAVTAHPERVIGMHWFNPPQVMRLIEVVRGATTADATVAAALELARRLGKETVVCQDSPGFVTSRLIMAWIVEASRILEEGVATREEIDKACRLAFNHPMGPFELADASGLDTGLSAADSLLAELGERFRAPQTLRRLVRAGWLGRKTGRGFYRYERQP